MSTLSEPFGEQRRLDFTAMPTALGRYDGNSHRSTGSGEHTDGIS